MHRQEHPAIPDEILKQRPGALALDPLSQTVLRGGPSPAGNSEVQPGLVPRSPGKLPEDQEDRGSAGRW